MPLVAGHEFKPRFGRCSCGKRWIDIRWADEAALGDGDLVWAHVGKLNSTELAEIRQEREEEDAAIARAMSDLGRQGLR